MSWTDVEPIVRTAPRCKASLACLKGNITKLTISLSSTFMGELDNPSHAEVQAGTGDMLGKMRLVFGKKGKFKITEMEKGGGKITMNAPEGLVKRNRESEACTIVERTEQQVIVQLPIDGWAQQAAAPAAETHRAASPSPPARVAVPASKVNIVEYLTHKGHKVAVERDGYRIDRELHTKASAVTMVNRYRRAAELEPVGLVDCV